MRQQVNWIQPKSRLKSKLSYANLSKQSSKELRTQSRSSPSKWQSLKITSLHLSHTPKCFQPVSMPALLCSIRQPSVRKRHHAWQWLWVSTISRRTSRLPTILAVTPLSTWSATQTAAFWWWTPGKHCHLHQTCPYSVHSLSSWWNAIVLRSLKSLSAEIFLN